MSKHSLQDRINSNTLWNHHTVQVENDESGYFVMAYRFDSNGTLAPNWEYIPASSYRATHEWHSLSDCPDIDTCSQVPYDTYSWKFAVEALPY